MDRLESFLHVSRDDIPLRALTLHMLEHLAPKLFVERGLKGAQDRALDRSQLIGYFLSIPVDADRLQAGVDAWYCRFLKGLPHEPPNPERLAASLQWLADDDQLIYAWLIGEQAARCGVDVRVPIKQPRPFMDTSRLHDAYWLTHLVMLDTDYFARPLSHSDAKRWADSLEGLARWLLENPQEDPKYDLAGEVALCLRFMGRDATALLSKLEGAAPTEDAHAQATALLALSAE